MATEIQLFQATRLDSAGRVTELRVLLPHHVVPFLRAQEAGQEAEVCLLGFDPLLGGLRPGRLVATTGGRAKAPMFTASGWGTTFAQQYAEEVTG